MAFDDMRAAARNASKKARSKGDATAHGFAAKMNDKVAKTAFSQGDAAVAKKHSAIAKEHRKQADKLATNSDSTSSDSDDVNNPLLTWANSK